MWVRRWCRCSAGTRAGGRPVPVLFITQVDKRGVVAPSVPRTHHVKSPQCTDHGPSVTWRGKPSLLGRKETVNAEAESLATNRFRFCAVTREE